MKLEIEIICSRVTKISELNQVINYPNEELGERRSTMNPVSPKNPWALRSCLRFSIEAHLLCHSPTGTRRVDVVAMKASFTPAHHLPHWPSWHSGTRCLPGELNQREHFALLPPTRRQQQPRCTFSCSDVYQPAQDGCSLWASDQSVWLYPGEVIESHTVQAGHSAIERD